MGHTSLSCIFVVVEKWKIQLTYWDSFGFWLIFLEVVFFLKFLFLPAVYMSDSLPPLWYVAARSLVLCSLTWLRRGSRDVCITDELPSLWKDVCSNTSSPCSSRLTRTEINVFGLSGAVRARQLSHLLRCWLCADSRAFPARTHGSWAVEGFVESRASTSSALPFPESPN